MTKPLQMTEAEFTNQLLAWAKTFGWRRFHVRSSGRMSNGKAIPVVQGDKGFPDLVLAKPGRLVFAELKVGGNKARSEQTDWLDLLAASNAECHVWTPAMWTQILAVLSK